MYLFFDDPEDPGIEFLSGTDRVTCIRCDAHHWQSLGRSPEVKPTFSERLHLNGDHGFALAQEAGFDWVVRIDSDELLYFERPLQQILVDSPEFADVVSFPAAEAVPEQLHYDRFYQGATLFKVGFLPKIPRRFSDGGVHGSRGSHPRRPYRRFREKVANTIGVNSRLDGGRYYRGHVGGKSAIRTTAAISSTKSHFPLPQEDGELTAVICVDAVVLHFDAIDYDRWKAKWMNRYRLKYPGTGKPRETQYNRFVEAYEKGEDRVEELYRRLYFLSLPQKLLLSAFGLLERIRLDHSRFQFEIHDNRSAGRSR